jgi:hypothetical protein
MSTEKPWLADGGQCGAKYEDMLIGNRAGLTKLKEAIEKAISTNQADLDDCLGHYNGIRVVDEDPRKPMPPNAGKVAARVFVVILIAVAVLSLLGVWKVIEILK